MKLVALIVAITALGLAPAPAAAAWLADESLQRLWDQAKFDDLQREARARTGPDALAAQAMVVNDASDNAATAKALTLAESCTQQHPEAAACYYALGMVLGTKAQSGSMFQGLRLVGRIVDALDKAVQLAPSMFEARVALQQVYLLVPSVAGGSVSKAKDLETQVRDSQPEVSKLLRANLAAKEDRWDAVERELSSLKLGEQASFHNQALAAWQGLVRHWLKVDQHAKARERFTQLAQALPELAMPVYMLGRIAADEGKHDEALKFYERARAMQGSAGLPLDYRSGIAHMDLGDKDKARAAFQRVISAKRVPPNNLEDAQRRLKDLG